MSRFIAAVATSLIAGFAIAAWLLGGGSRSTGEPGRDAVVDLGGLAPPIEQRLRQFEQAVADEREARIILEDQLQSLMDEIERIESTNRPLFADRQADAEEQRPVSPADDRRRDFASMLRRMQEGRKNALVNGGFSEDEARLILAQESEAQFKAMQAAYDAQRRGEPTDAFSTINSWQSLLRAELGDDEYERYLAAQGQPTAIQVSQVLGRSPGSEAGLQPGDQIISYDGERVFSVSELRALTLQGSVGEDVVIEIDRDGVRMQLTLPRGPVGISGSSANIRTMNWWGGT